MKVDVTDFVTKQAEIYVKRQIETMEVKVRTVRKDARKRLASAGEAFQGYKQTIDKIEKEKRRQFDKIKKLRADIDNAAQEASKECTEECNTGKVDVFKRLR